MKMDFISKTDIQKVFVFVSPVAVFLIVALIGFIVRKLLFSKLAKRAQETKTHFYSVFIHTIKGPSVFWLLMIAVYLALEFSSLPENVIAVVGKLLMATGLLSVTILLANLSSHAIKIHAGRDDAVMSSTTIIQNVSHIVVYGVGILVILNSLQISITPILTTLGVGGLAVALALQDTLSNLFAGFHISINQIVRVGDYVKLESGEKGYVIDINWRTTKIRMITNNVILVPNSKLTQSIITNYYFPEKEMAVLVSVGVHYNSDLKQVEQITCQVAKQVMQEVSGGVPEFTPFIRYHTFSDFCIQFTVILRCKEFVDQHLIKHEFIKRLHERYNKEGIVIPYPITAMNFSQERSRLPKI
jgi:small-conductance mechanosensitive channel